MTEKKGKITNIRDDLTIELEEDIYMPTEEKYNELKDNIQQVKSKVGEEVILLIDENNEWYKVKKPKSQETETEKKEIKKLDDKMRSIDGARHLKDEHMISIQGTKFVKHEGLLEVAHKVGLKSIETYRIDSSSAEEPVMFKAIVTMKDNSSFQGHGDAHSNNVNEKIKPHLIRMAETRAVNRALRLATNVGYCSAEELDKSDENGN